MPARFSTSDLAAATDLRSRGLSWSEIATRLSASTGRSGINGSALSRAVRQSRGIAASIADSIAEAPAPAGLTFGIEIEFRRPTTSNYATLDPEVIAQALRDAGVNCFAERYNHSTRSHWKLISDASSDRELVSPILSGEEGLAEVRTAMRVLRSLGCRVSSSEGMHVHIGASGLDSMGVVRVVEGYVRNSRLFDSVVSRNRRDGSYRNDYCLPIPPQVVARLRDSAERGVARDNLSVEGRYRTVNLQALSAHGTVEFRQHQGSLNGTKATAWVRLLLGFFSAATAGDVPQYGSVREMAEAFGVAAPSVEFLVRRADAAMAVAS